MLKERFAQTVKQIRGGQGLVNLDGPSGPDESVEFGIDPMGLPTFLPSVEEKAEPAIESREIPWDPIQSIFGPYWMTLPAHTTYAEKKPAGNGATMDGIPNVV